MSGPHAPSPTDHDMVTSLNALQAQFTAFQESLGSVACDVKDALAQLHALRTAQNEADVRVAELEGVIGVTTTGTHHARRDRGTTRSEPADVPEKTLLESVASIQSAIDVLLARGGRTSRSNPPEIRREPPALRFVNLTGQTFSCPSSPPSVIDPPSQNLAQLTCVSSQSGSSSPLSPIANPTTPSETPPPPSKGYAEAAVQARPLPLASSPSSSHIRTPVLTPLDWSVDPATLGRSMSNSVRPTAYIAEYLARSPHLPSTPNTQTHSQMPQDDNDHSLRGAAAPDTQIPTHTMSTTLTYPSKPMQPTTPSSRDISAAPLDSGVAPATVTSSPAGISIQTCRPQTSTLETEHTNSSMIPPRSQMRTEWQSSLTPLGSLASTCDTPVSGEHIGHRRLSHAGLGVQMTSGTPVTKAPSFPAKPSIQKHSFSAEGADSSMTPFPMGPTSDLRGSLSPSSSLSSIRDTVVSEKHGDPGRLHAEISIQTFQQRLSSLSPSSSQSGTRDAAMSEERTTQRPRAKLYAQTASSTTSVSMMETPMSPEKASIQTSPLSANSSLTPPPIGLNRDSRTSLSPLSSLTSTRDAPMAAGASGPEMLVGPRMRSDAEDASVTSDTDRDGISVIGEANTTPEFIPASPGHHRQSPPVEADDGGPTSGLFTPPSETVVDDRESRLVGRSTREHGSIADFGLVSRLVRNLPVIPTPPSLTPESELAGGEEQEVTLGAQGEGSGVASPLTPPSLSASPVHKGTDVPVELTFTATSGVSAAILTNGSQSIVVCKQGSSQVPRVTDPCTTPRPSDNQHGPDPSYSPLPNCYGCGDGYDFGFSSPLRRSSPLISTTPSRYATPSDTFFLDVRPRQDGDEDEVWRALALSEGTSGLSTPAGTGSDSLPPSIMFSHHTSRAPSAEWDARPLCSGPQLEGQEQPLSVDPSVLHKPQMDERGNEGPLSRSPLVSSGSMSSLSSIDDSLGVGDPAHPQYKRDGVSTDSPHTGGKDSASYGGRGSEPHHATPHSRAASEGRLVGGPGASVDELALLARRAPLKIYLRVPGGMMKGQKRKRDVDEDEDQGVVGASALGMPTPTPSASGRATESCTGQLLGEGSLSVPVLRKSIKKPHEWNEEFRTTRTALEISASILPTSIGEVTSAPSTATPIAHRLAPEHSTSSCLVDDVRDDSYIPSHVPASHKRTKRQREGGKHARVRQKKFKRDSKATSKSPLKYHVRNGQIVAVASTLEPPSPSPSQSEETGQDARTPTRVRHRKKQENEAINTPSSSPVNPNVSSPPSERLVRSSPPKENAQDEVSQNAGMWPELPSMFSQWDAQFILCDNCETWYHYGCVAIEDGDPRLEPSASFICPTCHTQSAKRKTLRNQDNTCGRSDCPEPQLTADESELFFVEKLVGRKNVRGYVYMWLAKWEGYPMTQATWIPKENVVGDDTRLFNAFLEDAIEEGADLTRDVVLLQEALEAGWEG